MARLTTEDCNDKVSNRFELVALASQRAKVISSGGRITVERDNDKDGVVALREIANGNIKPSDLRAAIIKNYQGKNNLHSIEEMENEITEDNSGLEYISENTDLYINQEESGLDDQEFDNMEDSHI